jgi:hypothetical protein
MKKHPARQATASNITVPIEDGPINHSMTFHNIPPDVKLMQILFLCPGFENEPETKPLVFGRFSTRFSPLIFGIDSECPFIAPIAV